MQTLREAILEETDFVKEAKNTEQFRQFVEENPELSGRVTAPKVYPAASASRVLTLERLYGVALTDLEASSRTSLAHTQVSHAQVSHAQVSHAQVSRTQGLRTRLAHETHSSLT